MKGYGQYCPIAQAAEILTERWTPLVLRELLVRGNRFNDIRRGVPLMSPSLLSKRLQELERAGLVERRVWSNGSAEYHLTPAGRELKPLIFQLGEWGKRWLQRTLTPGIRRAGTRHAKRNHAGRRRLHAAVETVEKPQLALIPAKKVLCFQQLIFQVQTFSTVSLGVIPHFT
jgi:DNA-binding HxlR family transcriptional regulator